MKKRAFTMAEVLITIGVIGTICAISLPALNTAIFNAQRTAGVKTTFSKLTEAWDMTVLDLEYAPKCAYINDTTGTFQDCEDFGKKIEQQLVIKQTCNGNGANQGCIAKYSEEYDRIAPSEFTAQKMNTKNYILVLNDGVVIIGSSAEDFLNPKKFAIDINGNKGPNRWGYDLFPVQSKFGKDGKKIYIIGVDIDFDKELDKDAINVSEILANKK